MGTVRFGNDHFAAITCYRDHVQGNLTISHVYYVEGLGHNLFSVGQFCDIDLEVAFRLNTCYVRNLEGDDLLTGSRDSNLYTISISEMATSSLVCLMSRATSTKSWLWHRRLSHLNFGTINQLKKPDVQYFHMFGSLCYPTNDRDDLGKMKPKADVETIHAKFDELMVMASECNNLEPEMNYMNFNDSSEDSQSVPSTSDLDNLFGPMYDEYYVSSSQEMFDNFAENTLDNDHTSSSSSIVVEQDDAPQIVSYSEDHVVTKPNSPVWNKVADEFVQEDVADFDGHMFHNAPQTLEFDVAETSSTYKDPSNMHQFHQKHRSIDG
ncbi:integrase, catalytic region, zinc finger, CCHC-type containing protein [Tanacetum coccineum]